MVEAPDNRFLVYLVRAGEEDRPYASHFIEGVYDWETASRKAHEWGMDTTGMGLFTGTKLYLKRGTESRLLREWSDL